MYVVDTRGPKDRAVEAPAAEMSILGVRDSFTETLMVNIALVCRRIAHRRLAVELMKAGRLTRTPKALVHVRGWLRRN